MSINALFDEFKVKAATPKQQLAEYKAQGKKVIGVLPYYAPEELVYAAGMVPMGIWGLLIFSQIHLTLMYHVHL